MPQVSNSSVLDDYNITKCEKCSQTRVNVAFIIAVSRLLYQVLGVVAARPSMFDGLGVDKVLDIDSWAFEPFACVDCIVH